MRSKQLTALLAAACLLLAGACGNDRGSGGDKAPENDTAGGDTADKDTAGADVGTTTDTADNKTCGASVDCPQKTPHCDGMGTCVRCVNSTHCPAHGRCQAGECIDPTSCQSDKQCLKQDGVCDDASGYCVDCLGTEDCGKEQVCKANTCMPAPKACGSSKDCAATVQVCDKKAGWCVDCLTADDCDDERHCSDGVCIPDVCKPGTATCDESGNRRACRADGGGWEVKACPSGTGCKGGACEQKACSEGETACQGDIVAMCAAGGMGWQAGEDCAKTGTVCKDGACAKLVCKPGKTVCSLDNKAMLVCNEDGTVLTTTSCVAGDCKDNACTKTSCTPGEKTCLGPTKLHICNAKGDGGLSEDCTFDAACDGGACKPKICTPSALSCQGKIAYKCNALGTALGPHANCGPLGKYCKDGACVDQLCKPNETTCSGDHKQAWTCRPDGSGWVEVPCTGGTTCELGTCKSIVCKPGQTECAGKVAVKCNALGTVATPLTDCAKQAKACKQGACVAQLCNAGQTECSPAGKLMTCAKDQLSYVTTDCGVGSICNKGSCFKLSCKPKTFTCSGNVLYRCDDKGLALVKQSNCGIAGKYCIGGACKDAGCGDSKVNVPGEQCDDGNNNDGDGCSSGCQNEPKCAQLCGFHLACMSDGTCGKPCKNNGSGGSCGIGVPGGALFDTKGTNSSGVAVDANGSLVLASAGQANSKPHNIWIAGTSAKVVSRLNTTTGQEVARYASCASPSRTAVDLQGNVWVGCRSGGQVMKIAGSQAGCKDKNGNGVIDTSADTNGNGTIGSGEMKPYGQDECVIFIVKPHASENVIRGVAVDTANHAWVGGWNRRYLWRLHPDTGKVVDSINLGCNPYGIAMGRDDTMWVSGRGCSSLVRVDIKTKQVTKVGHGGKGSPYGVAVDAFGKVWIANTSLYSSRYDPATNKWHPVKHNQRSRGIAADDNGMVYVALDMTSNIAVINATTLTTEKHISLGGGRYPVGVSVDFQGNVWSVNQSKATASKVDPIAGKVLGEYPVGAGPYTYSDMTGFALHAMLLNEGRFRTTFYAADAFNPFLPKKTYAFTEVNADVTLPAGAVLKMRYRTAQSTTKLAAAQWSAEAAVSQWPVKLQGASGPVLEVELILYASPSGDSPQVKTLSAKWAAK